MKASKPVQKAFHPLSLLTSLTTLPPTQLFLSTLLLASLLTLLYLYLILPPPSPATPTHPASSSPTTLAGCEVGGCSGEVCGGEGGGAGTSVCEWREEYGCYREVFAVCAPVVDGGRVDDECAWQMNEDMQNCLTATRRRTRDRLYGGVQ